MRVSLPAELRGGAIAIATTIIATTITATPNRATAADLHLGFQLGASEQAGTTISDSSALLLLPDGTSPTRTGSRLQGLQLTTGITGSVSADVVTQWLNHALVLGGGFSQLVPTAVPDDAPESQREQISNFQASARYLAVVQRPRWGLAFGAGWSFFENGRLVAPADGATPSSSNMAQASPGQVTLPSYIVSGRVHTLNATTQLQLLRLSWDLSLGATWTYSINGVFSLAPGAPGQDNGVPGGASRTQIGPQLPRITSNVGTFLQATTHAFTPSATFRVRAGSRGLVIANAFSTMTLPVAGTTTGTEAPALAQVPKTINSLGSLEYLHAFGPDRQGGLQANGTFGLRVPSDPITFRPLSGRTLEADSAVIELSAIYLDLLPGDVRLSALAGAAEPWLFQPALGSTEPIDDFKTVKGAWTPIFNLTLSRFFNPVNASVTALRRVTVGALGASAVVTNGASLSFAWQPRLGSKPLMLGLGFNVNDTRGIGGLASDNAPCDARCALLRVATTNRGFGANLSAQYPFLRDGMFTGLFGATYNVSWLDPDPDGNLGLAPYTTHAALATLTITFGRGPLQELGPGSAEGAELSAFSADPANGSPMTSARLLRAGAPLLDGTAGRRPGEPRREDPDDQQAAAANKRRQDADREAKARAGALRGDASADEEEAEALERQAEERRAREERRTRKFSEWPVDQMLHPKAEGTEEPPPGDPEEKSDAVPEARPDAKAKPKTSKPKESERERPAKSKKKDAKAKVEPKKKAEPDEEETATPEAD